MISFVILHYKNINDTIEAIESIKKIDEQNKISIIVVDNNTLSNDEFNLIKRYTDDIVLSNENLGVAKAYNLGAKYAIEKYKPDYICVMNNDILINQKEFISLIDKTYEDTKFDMLGTKIICEGDSFNPFPVYNSLEKINNQIEKNNKLIKIYSNDLKAHLFEIALKIKHIIKKPIKPTNGLKLEENVALHGCLIIFSQKYYQLYTDVMVPDTFLFHEEEFLYFRMIKNNLISIYQPKIEIIHKEGQALKTNNKNKIKRKKDKLIEINKSLNILKEKLENNEEF